MACLSPGLMKMTVTTGWENSFLLFHGRCQNDSQPNGLRQGPPHPLHGGRQQHPEGGGCSQQQLTWSPRPWPEEPHWHRSLRSTRLQPDVAVDAVTGQEDPSILSRQQSRSTCQPLCTYRLWRRRYQAHPQSVPNCTPSGSSPVLRNHTGSNQHQHDRYWLCFLSHQSLVPRKVKDQVWAGALVELLSLLPGGQKEVLQVQVGGGDGNPALQIVPQQSPPFQWLRG